MRKSFAMACAASAVAVFVGWGTLLGGGSARDAHAQQFYGQPAQQFQGPQYAQFNHPGQIGMAQPPFHGAPGAYQAMQPGMVQMHPTIQLQQAAQQLRESIQALAQLQPGDPRERALAAANRALLEAQQAVVASSRIAPPPPADVTVFGPAPQQFFGPPAFGSTVGMGPQWTTGAQQFGYAGTQQFGHMSAPQQWQSQPAGVQQHATVQLQQTAEQIRNSIQTLAQQPRRPEIDRALDLAHSALRDINQALVTVAAIAPPPPVDVTVYGGQQRFYR